MLNFAAALGLFPIYFSAGEVSVTTTEKTVVTTTRDISSDQVWSVVPFYSAYYRWTDLAGGNPSCTLKFRYGLSPVGSITPITYTDKNYVTFDGVDLFKHPISLTRALINPADSAEYNAGFTKRRFILQMRATTTDGTVAFGNNSLAGLYAMFEQVSGFA
jgi:hypothetical protein